MLDAITFGELDPDTLTQKDIDEINFLLPQLSSSAKPVTMAWVRNVLRSGTRIFVARGEGRIIALALLHSMKILVGQKDWLEDVVTDEKYRRRGISSALLDMIEAVSGKSRADSINLTPNPDCEVARRMYERRGYRLRETGVFCLAWKR